MKFSIRDLLLVTVIVALTAGWWVDHRRQAMKTNSDAWEIAGYKAEYSAAFSQIRELERKLSDALATLPNSSAPAPIPPSD